MRALPVIGAVVTALCLSASLSGCGDSPAEAAVKKAKSEREASEAEHQAHMRAMRVESEKKYGTPEERAKKYGTPEENIRKAREEGARA